MAVRARVVGVLLVRRQDREPGHGPLRAQRALQQRVIQRGGGVVQLLGQIALDDQAVHRRPGAGVHAGQREQRGPLPVAAELGQVVVDPPGEGEQGLGGRAGPGHLRPFLLGGADQAEAQLEPVRAHRGRARELGQPALAEPPFQVHLGQPEPGLQVAEGQEHVVLAGRPDRGHPVAGERHLDRVGQARQAQRLGVRQLTAAGRGPDPAAGVQGRAQRGHRGVAGGQHAEQGGAGQQRDRHAEHPPRDPGAPSLQGHRLTIGPGAGPATGGRPPAAQTARSTSLLPPYARPASPRSAGRPRSSAGAG